MFEENEIFLRRMRQLINYYGEDQVKYCLPILLASKPKRVDKWLDTNPRDLEVLKMHLNNLELTVSETVFELGLLVFFDLREAL